MQIVIDIPEDLYKEKIKGTASDRQNEKILKCVKNGTPLPKGHGDLIDRSEVIKSLFDYHNGKKTIGQCIDDVQTIIEADKGDNEDFNHEGFYNFLLNTIQPNEMEKYRNMFLSSGEIAN